jgi:hypothetical protein
MALEWLGVRDREPHLFIRKTHLMDWTTCPSCEEEFKILTDGTVRPAYCPFCSEELELEDLFDDEDDE